MPWCPKCKNEYKEGILTCADCGCELVPSLDDANKPVYFGDEEEIRQMLQFLKANGYEDASYEYGEEEGVCELFTKAADVDKVKKMLHVYFKEIKYKDEPVPQEEPAAPSVPYEESGKKAEDYRTGANTLLLVGVIGVVVLVLLNLGVIPINLPIFTKRLTTGVMGALFLIFIAMGISSRTSYKKLKNAADEEETTKEQLLAWVMENVTAETVDSSIPDEILASSTKEELYFKRNDKLKELLKQQSPESTDAFIDYMIEEIYGTLFGDE